MNGMTAVPECSGPAAGVRWRQVALPTEHGSWGFLLEPLVAGMVVAFSPAAPWIAVMVTAAFLARRPLQVMVAQRENRDGPIFAAASRMLLIHSLIGLAGVAGTALTAGLPAFLPLCLAAPTAFFQLYVETTNRGRQLRAELAGSAVMPATAAAIALAGGMTWPAATALWMLFAARFLPSVLYVRSRLALEKGKPHKFAIPALVHLIALMLVVALAFYGLTPMLPALVFVLLLARSVFGLSRFRTRMKAMRVGIWEVIYGTLLVAAVIIGYLAGV